MDKNTQNSNYFNPKWSKEIKQQMASKILIQAIATLSEANDFDIEKTAQDIDFYKDLYLKVNECKRSI